VPSGLSVNCCGLDDEDDGNFFVVVGDRVNSRVIENEGGDVDDVVSSGEEEEGDIVASALTISAILHPITDQQYPPSGHSTCCPLGQ
jgi:hypothetical protein